MGESVALQFRRLRLGVGHRCHQRSYLLGVVARAQAPHACDDADPLGDGCDASVVGGGFDRLHGLGSVSWGGLALGLVGFAGARGDSKLVGFGLLWPDRFGVRGCGGPGDRSDAAPTIAIALSSQFGSGLRVRPLGGWVSTDSGPSISPLKLPVVASRRWLSSKVATYAMRGLVSN